MTERPLSPFAKKICRIFAESYETSAMRRGGRKLRKASWQKVFPKITNDVYAKEAFLLAVEDLVRRGVLSVKWQRFFDNDRVEALYLEKPQQLFKLLDQKSPEEREQQALGLLDSYIPASSRSKELISHIKEEKKAEIHAGFDSPELLEALIVFCRCMEESFHDKWETGTPLGLPVRAVSIHIYNDSKRLEHCMKDFDSLFLAVYNERLSELYGLERSFPKTAFRGNIDIEFESDSEATWRTWKLKDETVFLPLDTVAHIQRIVPVRLKDQENLGNQIKKVLIIENLETFRYFDYSAHGFCGCMYGGGQANRADKALLKLLLTAGFSLWYFGDMDPEGLQIYKFFSIFCNNNVRPWGMNESLYEKYSMYGYFLDEAKRNRLQRLKIPEFEGLITRMLEIGVGVEQEIITF